VCSESSLSHGCLLFPVAPSSPPVWQGGHKHTGGLLCLWLLHTPCVCCLQMTISYEVPTFLLPFAAVSSSDSQSMHSAVVLCLASCHTCSLLATHSCSCDSNYTVRLPRALVHV